MSEVQQYHVHDFAVTSSTEHANPFKVALNATFEHESGEVVANLPGFHDGDGLWKIRFSPPLVGEWKGHTNSEDDALNNVDLEMVNCVPNESSEIHGTLRVDAANHQRFAWEDGTPFVVLGFECDWLFSYHQRDADRCLRHMDLIKERGFNYIVMNIYAHTGFSREQFNQKNDDQRPIDSAVVYGPPDLYCWGGTNDQPDHGAINPAFFHKYDDLMRILNERGIVAHIMIQVQNKQVNWPKRLSSDDDLYWRHVIARYQAYGNVVWDIGKESYNLHRELGGHSYTLNRIEFIRTNDVYQHLVTVHDPDADSSGCNSIADMACDFVSDQIHLKDAVKYNREAIRRQRIWPTPYMNIEYGYEIGVDQLKTYTGGTTARWEDVLKWTYALYAAGAYANYYYDNTSWDIIKFEPEPPGWKRYQAMKELLDSIPFNMMAADNELVASGLCLANEGDVYMVYLPEGGDLEIDLSAVEGVEMPAGHRDYTDFAVGVEWMDILSLERVTATAQPNGFNTTLKNPLQDRTQACVAVVRSN